MSMSVPDPGFRKVDPDQWEFAHVSFLRGQTHLLPQIVRRSGGGGGAAKRSSKDDGGDAVDEDAVAAEVVRLRREQRAIEDQVAAMWRRVQETERRPKQMLAFLVKVAGDPQVLRRLLASSSAAAGDASGGGGAGSATAVGFASAGTEDASAGAVAKRARLFLDGGAGAGAMGYGAGSSDAAVPSAAADYGGFYSADGGEDLGFGGEYLQPPPYVFPVNSGY
nr:unnamed protein product [Digitaria exilis]